MKVFSADYTNANHTHTQLIATRKVKTIDLDSTQIRFWGLGLMKGADL
jgi:hypothetical protein